jgi:hypothetical protein
MTFSGRPGKRTRQQRVIEMLRRNKSSGTKYNIGGIEKTGKRKPKPITLPTIKPDSLSDA